MLLATCVLVINLKESLLCERFNTKKLENFNAIELKMIDFSNLFDHSILIVEQLSLSFEKQE